MLHSVAIFLSYLLLCTSRLASFGGGQVFAHGPIDEEAPYMLAMLLSFFALNKNLNSSFYHQCVYTDIGLYAYMYIFFERFCLVADFLRCATASPPIGTAVSPPPMPETC